MDASVGAVSVRVVLLLFVAAAGGAADPTPVASTTVGVSECRTISAPGHYELTANLSAPGPESCVRIRASDVALDGGGHAIRSTGPTRSLVVVRDASNVTVTNLSTVGGADGVTFWNVTEGRIAAVTATGAARMGIWVVDSAGIEVDRATASRNAFSGIRLDDTANSAVSESTVSANAAGLTLGRSRGVVVRDSTFRDNGIGIELAGAAENTLARNTIAANEFGIVLAVSRANLVVNNSLEGTEDGIRLDEADDNDLRRNRLTGHAFGLYLNGASGNTLRENVVERAGVGIELTFSSDDNEILRNRIRARRAGIRQTLSDDNTLVGNDVAVIGTETDAGPPSEESPPETTIEAAGLEPTARSIDRDGEPRFGTAFAGLALVVAFGVAVAWLRSRPPGR